jgi:hypothetical protein
MNEHIEPLIDVYLDGELTVQQARQVEAHTAICETCRSVLNARQQLSALIQGVPGVENMRSGAKFANDVLDALDGDYIQDVPWWSDLRDVVVEIWNWLVDRRVQQAGWVAIPVILLLGSVFIRSVEILNTIFSLVPESNILLRHVFKYVEPIGLGQVDPFWRGALGQMVAFNIGDWTLITGLFGSLLIGFLYTAWIAGWLSRVAETDPVEVTE